MKMKVTLAVLASMVLAYSGFSQGQVTFNNSTTKRVIDSRTDMGPPIGVFVAGLYYSTDLSAAVDTESATDGLSLAFTTPVTTVNNVALYGLFNSGAQPIAGVPEATQVLLQARIWEVGYASYEEAFNAGGYVGSSGTFNATLGGPTTGIPIPSTSALLPAGNIVVTPVPEPSTVVLGILGGLGAMVLLRRRK